MRGKSQRYQEILQSGFESKPFVEKLLEVMEADVRELALAALAEWGNLEIVLPPAREDTSLQRSTSKVWNALFTSIGGLQRPAWGSWNGLLRALRGARQTAQNTADGSLREKIGRASRLNEILEYFERSIDPDALASLAPLREQCRHTSKRAMRLREAIDMAIYVRNRIAHDRPEDLHWWGKAAAGLSPLAGYLAETPMPEIPADGIDRLHPWFIERDGQLWVYNGLAGKEDSILHVIYVTSAGGSSSSEEEVPDVLLAFQKLMGRKDLQERDFSRLLGKLAPKEMRGVILDDYLVGREVASGGFATVHVGRQLSTGRKVAVKILRDGMPHDMRDRFRREASFLAQFNHPNIVSVLGSGEEPWIAPRFYSLSDEDWYKDFSQGARVKSFIALEWVEGLTLDDVITAEEKPGEKIVAEWFAQTATGLRVLHDSGLIHRDVKPSNIMVTEDSTVKLMDLGIARTQIESNTVFTRTGTALGTPAYMSPEQIRAVDAEAEVGPGSDIYSLCATFYEVATGARVFSHDTESAEMVRKWKCEGEKPLWPASHLGRLSWELETLIMGGLEPEPSDRPRSAAHLEQDLRAFLSDMPITYKRPNLLRRSRLFYRRHKAPLRVAAVFTLVLVLSTLGYLFYLKQQWDKEHAARVEAQHNLGLVFLEKLGNALVTKNTNAANIYSLHAQSMFLKEGNASGILRAVAELVGTKDYPIIRRIVPALANAGIINSMSFSPNGRILATASSDMVTLWDVSSGKEISELEGHTDEITSISFSPDEKTVASGSVDKTIRLWNLSSGKEIGRLEGNNNVFCVAFSPDGKSLASCSDVFIRLWDVSSAKQIGELRGGGTIYSVSFSPDGKVLACPSGKGSIRLWDLDSGVVTNTLQRHQGDVGVVSFSSDGKILASTSDKSITLWSISSGKEISTLEGHRDNVSWISFSPDGKMVASASNDRSIRLWDVDSGKNVARIDGHVSGVSRVSFSPDGRILASGVVLIIQN